MRWTCQRRLPILQRMPDLCHLFQLEPVRSAPMSTRPDLGRQVQTLPYPKHHVYLVRPMRKTREFKGCCVNCPRDFKEWHLYPKIQVSVSLDANSSMHELLT